MIGRTSDARSRNPAVSVVGRIVLVVSGLGFPLTQAVIARGGRRGAAAAEGVAVGLLGLRWMASSALV